MGMKLADEEIVLVAWREGETVKFRIKFQEGSACANSGFSRKKPVI